MLFTPRPKGLGRDSFLSLNDREEVTGIFKGEPYTFKRHWTNQRSVECTGEGCPICSVDPESYPSFRFRINFIISKEGQWIPKIFEGGGETYDLLTSLDKKVDLSKTFVDISRQGLKQNTKYHFFARNNEPMTKEMKAKIDSVQLLPLSTVQQVEEAVGA
jgi:hypothetical protein